MSKLLECHQQRWTNFAYSKTFPAFPARCLDPQQILSMCYKLRSNSSHDCRKIRRVSIRMLTTSSPRTFRPSRTCRPAFSLSARTSSSSITANSKVKGPSLLSLSHPVSVGRETEHFLVKFLCSKQASGLYTWSFILRDEPNQEFHRCSWNKCCQGILMSSFFVSETFVPGAPEAAFFEDWWCLADTEECTTQAFGCNSWLNLQIYCSGSAPIWGILVQGTQPFSLHLPMWKCLNRKPKTHPFLISCKN